MFRRMQAKLTGFLEPMEKVFRVYPETDRSVPARYARSIAHFKVSNMDRALELIDGLIEEKPADPYFYELKGQMLFEHGRLREALQPYRKAVELAPQSPLLNLALAQVEVNLNSPELDNAALDRLGLVLAEEPRNWLAWRLKAIAHGRKGDTGQTALALAESALSSGRYNLARQQAARAAGILPEGSPGWLRSQDIDREAQRAQARREDR